MVRCLRSSQQIVLEPLLMPLTKIAIKTRQLKESSYNKNDNAQLKPAEIDWPILTFWLTYFGIMFAILCGVISRGM
jgi:hypothetical protein